MNHKAGYRVVIKWSCHCVTAEARLPEELVLLAQVNQGKLLYFDIVLIIDLEVKILVFLFSQVFPLTKSGTADIDDALLLKISIMSHYHTPSLHRNGRLSAELMPQPLSKFPVA